MHACLPALGFHHAAPPLYACALAPASQQVPPGHGNTYASLACLHASNLQSLRTHATPPLIRTCRCPPGHGDIYASLVGSGMLDRLIVGQLPAVVSSSWLVD